MALGHGIESRLHFEGGAILDRVPCAQVQAHAKEHQPVETSGADRNGAYLIIPRFFER